MKCKCGRTMRWALAGNFKQKPDRRVYHCPKCSKSRADCNCPLAWAVEELGKPGWSPAGRKA